MKILCVCEESQIVTLALISSSSAKGSYWNLAELAKSSIILI